MITGVELEGTGLPALNITRVSAIGYTSPSEKKAMIHLNEFRPGEWHLVYTAELLPEIKKLTALRFLRNAIPSISGKAD